MPKPQQPELRRSSRGATDDSAVKEKLTAQARPGTSEAPAPVPEDNLPGHHPDSDQDKPVERFRRRAQKVAAEAHEHQREVRGFSVEVGEFRFDGLEAGRAAGDLVLLLHGFPQTSLAWRPVLEALAEGGFHCAAPDQRGYSPAAQPPNFQAYRLDELVADVLDVADRLGGRRFHLVGHDWGGVVAWALAARRPERLHTLTVVSTPHPAAYATSLFRSPQLLRSSYMLLAGLPVVPERLLAARDGAALRSLLVRTGLDATVADEYARILSARRAVGPALNWYRALPLMGRVGDISVPTLYVWGDRDPALGQVAAKATAAHVSGPYRFEVLPGAGHWIPEMAADRLTPLLLEHLGVGAQVAAG